MTLMHIIAAQNVKSFCFEDIPATYLFFDSIRNSLKKVAVTNFCSQHIDVFKLTPIGINALESNLKPFIDNNKEIWKILTAFKSVQVEHHICILHIDKLPTIETATLHQKLKLMDVGLSSVHADRSAPALKKKTAQIASILEFYDVSHFNPEKLKFFGEQDKKQRVCRYCQRSKSDGANFKSRAHAIPESIGNKTIFSNEECDDCNHFFSNSIEQDLFDYLKIWRVLRGAAGKKSIPKLKSKNGYEISNSRFGVVITDNNGTAVSPLKVSNIHLIYERQINYTNIYRAFAKAVVGVVEPSELSKMTKLAAWIRYSEASNPPPNLPKVSIALGNKVCDQPVMNIYRRKNDNAELPYMFAEFFIARFIFVVILPFVENEQSDFSDKSAFDHFWSLCGQYKLIPSWEFLDWSADEKIDYDLTLNFEVKA
ncbi:HNH endonuclease [Pseudovibrio sp. FO-BEG1]|uniref:HNH endonuclease n=1 Tax=Pseudovibrio sp. (strain FO-BEG1) TaxID=911045 RepID=UPI0002E773B4|nr:HNH endonuclease [Pseudovibrio sp. FO-BEG1]